MKLNKKQKIITGLVILLVNIIGGAIFTCIKIYASHSIFRAFIFIVFILVLASVIGHFGIKVLMSGIRADKKENILETRGNVLETKEQEV
jgi:hypothetical protein